MAVRPRSCSPRPPASRSPWARSGRRRSAGRRASWASRSPWWSAATSCATTPTRLCSGSTTATGSSASRRSTAGWCPVPDRERPHLEKTDSVEGCRERSSPRRRTHLSAPCSTTACGSSSARTARRPWSPSPSTTTSACAVRARGPHRLRPPLRAPDVPGLGEPRRSSSTSATCRAAAAPSTAARTWTTPTTSRCCRATRSSSRCSSRPTGCAARALTQDNLDNQIAVVQNEIRVNVLNRPYGGFPWIKLPPMLFDTFANAHDGYGDVRRPGVARRSPTPRSSSTATTRRATRCSPSSATSTRTQGSRWSSSTSATSRRAAPTRPYFARAAARPRSAAASLHRPARAGARDRDRPGGRPTRRRPRDFLPYVVLAEVLSDGDASPAAAPAACSATGSVTERRGYLGS